MFNLPKATEIKKNIYKKIIYEKFSEELSGKKKERFDKDISRIAIINEISEQSIKIPKTEEVPAIFVLKIDLRTKDYLETNIVLISKLFGQKLLLVLAYQDEYKLAIYETRLITSNWQKEDNIEIKLIGLNLKSVWENLVTQVGDIEIAEGNSLKDQIEIESQKGKLKKLIESTEKRARRETQAKKKFELYKQIKEYKKELEGLDWTVQ